MPVQDECRLALAPKNNCAVMHFNYRLNYIPESQEMERFANFSVGVEVKFSFTYRRCPEGLSRGDLVYSNTLLPGETVRLFSSDRRSKFTYDSSSAAANRNVQSSEESFQAQQVSDSMFDFSSRNEQDSSYQNKSHVDGHADAGVDFLGFGGEANMSGNFNSSGSSTFAAELTQHARSSSSQSAMSTRKAASISIGESQTRNHASGSSEEQYESSSRAFKNPNACHALTFLFYQIDKNYKIQFRLDGIHIRVYNARMNNTRISANPVGRSSGVGVLSTQVLATDVVKIRAAESINNVSRVIDRLHVLQENTRALPSSVVETVTNIVKKELQKEGLINDAP